ncbi:MAG TPA: energy transducer TonB, partial [Kofleriaceae bacterium]|nr:energy transducer TonB [Kofleriaceae bacterium]
MPIRPHALAIALGIHVVIVVMFLVARDWNAEPPKPPDEPPLVLTTIETVPPPPVVIPEPGASGGVAPIPRPAPGPPRPVVKKKAAPTLDEDAAKRMVDLLSASSTPSTDAELSSRRPTADLGAEVRGGGYGLELGGGAGRGGGLGGTGDGVDLSAKPQPLDTTSASTLPYTKEAMADHVEGDVTLMLQIDDTGIVTSTRIVRGIGHGLDDIAATVARKFTF